jgi:hypothetical protein
MLAGLVAVFVLISLRAASPTMPAPPLTTTATTSASVEVRRLKVSTTPGEATLSWELTSTKNVLHLVVEESIAGASWTKLPELPATATSTTIAGLPAGAASFRVWAVVKQGVNEASVRIPTPKEPPVEPPERGAAWIGTNDPVGWGVPDAQATVAAGIKGARIEGPSQLPAVIEAGYKHVVVIVGNTADGSRLSSVNKSAHAAEVAAEGAEVERAASRSGLDAVLEDENEAYLKGGGHNGEAATYASIYEADAAALRAGGVKLPLLANLDVKGWSTAMSTSTLKQMVADGGFSIHPYGRPAWAWGWSGYQAELQHVESITGMKAPFYMTEYGVELNGASQGNENFPGFSLKTESERATGFAAMLANCHADPQCRALIWFESHNEVGQSWGFKDRESKPLPLMKVIAAAARAGG